MTFLGFGLSPFGTSPMGFGAVPAPNSTAAQLFKKSDGSQGNAPMISATTLDYVLDPTTGIRQGADSTPMMVQWALLTLKGSSAVVDLGLQLPGGVFSPDLDKKCNAAARAALKHMTSRKLISIQRVRFVRNNVRAGSIRVDWVNLNTGELKFNEVSL